MKPTKSETKAATIICRVTPEIKASIDREAKKSKTTTSEVVRKRLSQ
jgi:hypothetical protein